MSTQLDSTPETELRCHRYDVQPMKTNPIAEPSPEEPVRHSREYPQLIKYMGSKAKIISFVAESIASIHDQGSVCDLFSGAASLSGALGGVYSIHTNDIQKYSSIIASVYLKPIDNIDADLLLRDAKINYKKAKMTLPSGLEYQNFSTLKDFNEIEVFNRTLIDVNFTSRYHLFLKNYSGTWWSAEQCLWIDAIKQAIDKQVKNGRYTQSEYALAMSTLMHAMAYCSQGTGHYAQYRDAKTASSMKDINLYRQKQLDQLFIKKLKSMIIWSKANVVDHNHRITTLDYIECLQQLKGGTVYADPPYAFVHYSRFYHAMETLSLYDYPQLQIKKGSIVKGRYREERHQSPFCIRSKVGEAFENLFAGVKSADANLALSYSNTAMISLENLLDIAKTKLTSSYEIWIEELAHQHMTMGRQNDRHREVREIILMAKRSNA